MPTDHTGRAFFFRAETWNIHICFWPEHEIKIIQQQKKKKNISPSRIWTAVASVLSKRIYHCTTGIEESVNQIQYSNNTARSNKSNYGRIFLSLQLYLPILTKSGFPRRKFLLDDLKMRDCSAMYANIFPRFFDNKQPTSNSKPVWVTLGQDTTSSRFTYMQPSEVYRQSTLHATWSMKQLYCKRNLWHSRNIWVTILWCLFQMKWLVKIYKLNFFNA